MAGGAYFTKAPSLSDVPNFVSAESPQGLRRAMLKNNLKLKAFVNYSNIQFANGRWFAWYVVDISTPGQELPDGSSDNR